MNFFEQVRESVIDYRFYKRIKDNSFGKSFGYLLLLFLIIYSFGAIKEYVYINRGLNEATTQLTDNLADFKLENGQLDYQGNMPHYFLNSSQALFALDTTGQLTEAILKDKENGILIAKEGILVKNPAQLKTFYYKSFSELTITKKDVLEFIPMLHGFAAAFLVLAFIFVLAYKLLNAFLLALLAMGINSAYQAKLPFRVLFNISIYALTLPLILELAVKLSPYGIPYFVFIYWFISLAYVARVIMFEKMSQNQGPNPMDTL